MKLKHYLALALLLSLSPLFSQQKVVTSQNNRGDNSLLLSTSPITINENIEGTPYVNEEFLPAKISASEGEIFFVRYNAATDQFEVKSDKNGSAFYLDKYRRDIQIKITPLDKTYQIFGYLDEDLNEQYSYFIYLTDADKETIVFKREKVSFIGEKIAVTTYDKAQPAHYKRWNDSYYIKTKDGILLIEVPTNKKDFSKLFPEHQKEILGYIKDNKLKPKREEDLIQIVDYINTL
ncbi:hypothetical protein AB9K26_13535 [Psychroserpens sp. XS_ASV72]|uniref:hypothetical protein n=1 Tax=Psychroserpens sp. XS_ASV72 TaxID=3241293 RepID=UPI003514C120